MADDLGESVKNEISAPYRKVGDFVSKVFGGTKEEKKPDAMKTIPDSNANKQAWQEATKFTAKPAPIVNKTLGTAKRATKGKATQKTARKRY